MLVRIAFVALILSLFIPTAGWADGETWRTESGGTTLDNHLSPGECLYVRPVATGQSQVLVAVAIEDIQVSVNCNLAGTDNDCAVEAWRCGEGQTTYDANACKVHWFRNEAGVAVKVFDGDESTGTGTSHGLVGPLWFINTTSHPSPGVREMEVSMCMKGGAKTPGTTY